MLTLDKEIRYDRATGDYALYLNGALVGFASTYHDGEERLNELAYAELLHQPVVAKVAESEAH